MARDFWIMEIRVPDAVEDKLRTKHNLTGDEIRSACVPRAYIRAAWKNHPVHGWRLVVETEDQRSRILVLLRPIDEEDGIWQLRTAWRMI